MKKLLGLISLYLSITLIVGCGGGGSSSDSGGGPVQPVASTSSFPLNTAWLNFLSLQGSKTFTLQITSSGVTSNGNGTVSFGGLQTSTFFGNAAKASTKSVTGTYLLNGKNTPFASTTTMYVDSSNLLVGRIDSDQGIVHSLNTRSLPTSVKVGDTGTLFQTNRYSTYTPPTQFNPYPNISTNLGTSTFTFVVEPDTANTAILKIITYNKDTKGVQVEVETTKLKMSTDGSVVYLSETSSVGADSVVLTFQ